MNTLIIILIILSIVITIVTIAFVCISIYTYSYKKYKEKLNKIKANYISEFVRERNEALFSLDEAKIKAYLKKRGISLPTDDKIFWGAVYKSICNITDAPQKLKDKAKAWLKENNMSEEIF